MTDYDPNLPQEFAHAQKRRGPGAIMILLAVVAVFALSALFATLRERTPATSPAPSTQEDATTSDGAETK